MTEPTAVRHPSRKRADQVFRDAEAFIRASAPGADVSKAVSRAEWVLDQARRSGASLEKIVGLEVWLKELTGLAHERQRAAMILQPAGILSTHFTRTASEQNIKMAITALRSEGHYASDAMRANIVSVIEGNGRIPKDMKGQLPQDVARVLELCPHAGGLATELTARGQRRANIEKLSRNSNEAIGAAYELMGIAALSYKPSIASNPGAPALYIEAGRDNIVFGHKTYLNGKPGDNRWVSPERRTIEDDTLISRGTRHIGVDFKHEKNMGTKSSLGDLRSQVKHVAQALKSDQIAEYHFVTNGTFGATYRGVIDDANRDLVARGLCPIAYHERVTTLAP